jgi:hypothetical protein
MSVSRWRWSLRVEDAERIEEEKIGVETFAMLAISCYSHESMRMRVWW